MSLFDAFSKKKSEELPELTPPPLPDFEPEPAQALPPEPEPIAAEETPATQPARQHAEGPLFVSVQDYEAILNSVNSIKEKLSEAESSFQKLQTIKKEQEQGLEDWRLTLEDVQRKLTYVDDVLFGR